MCGELGCSVNVAVSERRVVALCGRMRSFPCINIFEENSKF
jgi:hypothetical protein